MTRWASRRATWRGDCGGWCVSRWRTARQGLEELGVRGAALDRAAALVVAHWRLETACGSREWNFGVGAIHCVRASPLCVRIQGATRHEDLRAYVSLRDACRDYLRTIRASYSSAWRDLLAGDLAWFWVLAQSGYIEPGAGRDSAVRDYERVLVSTLGKLRFRPWFPTDLPWSPASAPPRSRRGGGGGGGAAIVLALLAGAALVWARR